VHQVDAKHERNGQSLLGRKLGEQCMLGAAGAAAFRKHGHRIVTRGCSPIWEAINQTSCFLISTRACAEKKQRLWNSWVIVPLQVCFANLALVRSFGRMQRRNPEVFS